MDGGQPVSILLLTGFEYLSTLALIITIMNNWTEWDEQVFEAIGRMKRAQASRAASSPEPRDDVRISEMDSNGVLVSRPVKKLVNIEANQQEEKEPIVIDLQKSKAASVPGINKIKAIHNFITSNGTRF